MRFRNCLFYGLIVLVTPALAGCVHAQRNAAEFPIEHSITVRASFDDTWQAVKGVLREQGLVIDTRDRRGSFLAFTGMNRRFYQPRRVKYEIEIAEITDEETRVHIATVRQAYGVTLLTYPGWHDRRTTDDSGARAILDALQARLSGEAPEAPEAVEAM